MFPLEKDEGYGSILNSELKYLKQNKKSKINSFGYNGLLLKFFEN